MINGGGVLKLDLAIVGQVFRGLLLLLEMNQI